MIITLILDLGTNGKILLSSGTRMLCCSTAAGPAFEGAHITCGMRGAQGAVDRVEISPITFEPKLRVIGDEKPKGLCGSGLVSLLNELIKVRAILRNGSYSIYPPIQPIVKKNQHSPLKM